MVAVDALRLVVVVVEEVLGIELLMAPGPPAAAVEGPAAALGDDADGAAGHAPELRLEVRRQHPDLGHRVHVGVEVRSAVGPGIQVDDAVHGEVHSAGPAAVDVDTADGILTGGGTSRVN